MGGADLQPGKQSAVYGPAPAPAPAPRAPAADERIGKRTLAGSYVMDGAPCEAGGGDPAACFLQAAQRARLGELFGDRVAGAREAYRIACTELKVDRLLQKPEDLPWWVGVLVDAISMVAGTAIAGALRAIRQGGMTAMAQLGTQLLIARPDAPSWATATYNALAAISPKAIEDTVKRGIDPTKKALTAKHVRARGAGHGERKAEDLSYLNVLQDDAGVAFQQVRETAPATLTDTQLLVLFESYDARYHTVSIYRAELAKKVARFRESGVARVGLRTFDEGDAHLPSFDHRLRSPDAEGARSGGGDGGIREKKVVWVQYGSGAPGHYGYAHRDWNGPNWTTYRGREVRQQPPEQDSTTAVPYYGGPIPAEFTEAAVLRHEQVFGEPPLPFLILEHEWPILYAHHPERMRRSRANLEQVMEGIPNVGQERLPRLDLKPPPEPRGPP